MARWQGPCCDAATCTQDHEQGPVMLVLLETVLHLEASQHRLYALAVSHYVTLLHLDSTL